MNKHSQAHRIPCILSQSDITKTDIEAIASDLCRFNDLTVVSPVLGFIGYCFVKEAITSKVGRHNPFMLLHGASGSGKSQTIERIVIPIFSSRFPFANIANETTDKILWRANKIAKCLREHGVRMNAISRDLILQIFGKEEALRIYPQIQTEEVSGKGKDLMARIEGQLLDDLQSMGYSNIGRIVEHIHTYGKWKTVTDRRVKRYVPGLLKKHGLIERTANKELKTQLDIETKGYPKVIVKKPDTDGTVNVG